ncbi:MAG: 50S ribosomal protein L18 [Sediminibacterium sp.]|nr:50S ribosomal protein L18 [Sediminibacterium sp.]
MKKLSNKEKIKFRIRKRIKGTADRPRLTVYRSNSEIYAQLIDDVTGNTLVSASSLLKEIKTQKINKTEQAKLVGVLLAQKAKEVNKTSCIFDRNGNLYHGRIKSLADGAREGGLNF